MYRQRRNDMSFGQVMMESIPVLLEGTIIAVELMLVTLLFALPLGMPLALGENSRIKPVKWLCNIYVFVFRGTPLLLQIFFVYYVFPIAWGIHIPEFPAAAMAFILNYAAYFAEIYRGGINSIDRGQYEAAYSLGLSRGQTMFGVIIPQMMRVVLPPVGNEIIVLVKDTALVSVIGVADIMKRTREIQNREVSLAPYLVAAIIYLIVTLLLTLWLNHMEKRFSKYDEVEA
ncbi:MAG: amino acid ABC transporter permease [Anaerovoracaceae bacterium]|nr:amino acid ABC transporter permease [Anaerovoracaceae bacterium]